ncbi:hypothetical protein diail_1302 [Diaporthe ilicicola]|nr:hypothetical protein diail_1302 [Diaporthe ilicicola]
MRLNRLSVEDSRSFFEEHKASNIFNCIEDPGSLKQNSMDRCNASKLLNLLWLRELDARTDGSVIINGVNPASVPARCTARIPASRLSTRCLRGPLRRAGMP